ncbi:DUF1674 domain-containing protein [Luteimonas sp. MC1782]|nr:DUF1674 domain-containing protein [Luteimonas sp. MC1895]MBJ6984254.1 DUF1674 domain-containing protein [Luteimonas sp. MC1750]MBJ6985667.1 DUF1674 domain-containing protein [Luteimonas sp. MC1750]QQO07230.1 DUF1674 domain-containing protein [Luteimonas sp. MC1750]
MIGETPPRTAPDARSDDSRATPVTPPAAPEHGGREGLDPTRYGDWEKNGRCIDF